MVIMDTYVNVDWNKCAKCYKCVELCTKTYKDGSFLGYLIIDDDGIPEHI